MSQIYYVEKDCKNVRLDQWLKKIFPDLGLRAIRRLIQTGQILVNEHHKHLAYKVQPDDAITYKPCVFKSTPNNPTIIAETDKYIFFAKPNNIHTVALKGGLNISLEDQIKKWAEHANIQPILLQRLDFETSGIICAAKTTQAASQFRQNEAQGLISKKYLAILKGPLTDSALATNLLDTTHKLVRQTSAYAKDVRYTAFKPLAHFRAKTAWPGWFKHQTSFSAVPCDLTLVGCTLKMGLRHQIRTHAKYLGYPLWLDIKYGEKTNCQAEHTFYLHQGAIFGPNISCILWPDWLNKSSDTQFIKDWLESL